MRWDRSPNLCNASCELYHYATSAAIVTSQEWDLNSQQISVDFEKSQIFENMPRGRVDPGLLRPQRNVLSITLHTMQN